MKKSILLCFPVYIVYSSPWKLTEAPNSLKTATLKFIADYVTYLDALITGNTSHTASTVPTVNDDWEIPLRRAYCKYLLVGKKILAVP